THLTRFDSPGTPAPSVGWIRGTFAVDGIGDPAPYFVAMPSTDKAARPVGLAIGLEVPPEAPRDFYARDEDYRREYLIAAPPGRYFVAAELTSGDDGKGVLGSKRYRGYTHGLFGLPRYFEVKAETVTDARDTPIRMTPLQ